jgi:Calcium binding
MAPEDACAADMLVLIRWQGRTMAVPLPQLAAVDPDESTAEAIGDWHYWISQGYCFSTGTTTQAYRKAKAFRGRSNAICHR